ncbi:glycoside hydrolase family 3 protein [Konateibacter massiliensis]|uniref:glycoside hydrolase family 3 protein n=1 Tax=Konateibacter massiliensis TaxID=2002841 RepID=UPI000C14A9C1|nr:glycoside hydrolase family 3 protein [Konateibacter massiliensis]
MEKKEKKVKKIRRPSRIAFGLMSFLLAILLGVNVVVANVVSPYFGFVNNFLSEAPTDEDALNATEASAKITQEMEEEGIIMLTNNGALPLNGEKNVNVFGTGSIDFTYGGTGSGSGDSSKNTTLIQGLENADFITNTEIQKYYEENAKARENKELLGSDFGIYEIPADQYDTSLIENAKAFSDVAIVVFSRVGGEGFDCQLEMEGIEGGDAGKSYLELQDSELSVLQMAEENFGTVVVILNSPNVMELGFLNHEAVDASLWVGCPGSTGCNAIGEVLTGAVNPSGHTTDTFAYEVESNPTYYNFGGYDYTNATYVNTAMFAGTSSDATAGGDNYHYVEYQEGIYVGYRYYETAAADGFIDYDETVQFPFGYGLSYTSFDEQITSFTADGKNVSMEVTVTNTGATAGKDVVEIYYTAPYTIGGIEKSQVVLVDFAKTSLLEAGASEKVVIEFSYEDMASYDYSGVKAEGGAYVLEAGDYAINLQENSHNIIDSRTVTVDRDYIYNEENDDARSTDEVVATNQFDDVSFGTGITYLSRADWAGTMPTERVAASKEATDKQLAELTGERTYDDSETEDIIFKKNGLQLKDMKGLDYDDEKWDLILQQLSLNDMEMLISNGGWCTFAVKSVGKPYLSECDGPNGVNNIMAGVTGNQFAAQSVLGFTWNTELAERMGEVFGQEAIAYGISGIYAPGLNIHRSPFSGRNYEYVSEDGTLTGIIGAAEIKGIQSCGVYCYTKHYALNDQETNRSQGGLCTWANEQAMREIYMKGFELAVKDGESMGIMSSYNRIGTTPVAESYQMLTTVLRDEWGFVGCVITDCVMACYTQDINASLRAGNDLQLTIMAQSGLTDETKNTPAGHQAMRNACHNILYMIANSSALENNPSHLYGFQIILILVDVALFALFALYYVRRHFKMKRWKESLIVIE